MYTTEIRGKSKIASNFETDKKNTENLIEKTLFETFGFEIPLLVRDAKNIEKICNSLPPTWANDDEQKTDILFLWKDFDDEKSFSLIETSSVDTLRFIDGAIAWNVSRKDYKKVACTNLSGRRYIKT